MPDSFLTTLQNRQALQPAQIEQMAEGLLSDAVADAEKAVWLKALAEKGESVEEIAGFVRVFLRHAVRPDLDLDYLGPALDVCGTGGDKLDLFNVSTTSMFVLAGGGATVVKHGNRGITSKSGGADVLEALGIRIDLPPEHFVACVEQTGVGFMFAPHYHPAFKAVAGVRKILAAEGVRTIFNLIGPLLNPVQPMFQLVGVADARLPKTYAAILGDLGRVKAWAVHGTTAHGQGMDELSTSGPTHIARYDAGDLTEETLNPASIGLPPASLDDLRGGDAQTNAAILTGILDGSLRGPKRDMVVLNAAGGFQVTGQARTWEEALAYANEVIDNGSAKKALTAMREYCADAAV